MRQWALAGGLLLVVGSLTACATEEDPPTPTLSDFCAAVERAPNEDTSIARTRAAADVEQNSPPEIHAEVTTMREALEKVSTATELDAFAEQGGPVQAASRRYHAYIDEHCFLD